MTLLGMNHDPEEAIEKINGTEEQKNQFKEIIQEYNRQRELLKLSKKFKEKMITKTFLEMKMKDKFLEERYQKFYQRCERIYNELPSSFINKWEHNTELKEFLN
jgi:benzoyl-CoA reductase/2-hydroxyglutaryl-CoA dehydratase subunit BcrC/BadD/HgdB